MAEPLDVVKAFHSAFRRDMAAIDAAAHDTARGKPGLEPVIERFRFFNEELVWHARAEELAVFPALEAVVPSVVEAYARDHRGLDAAYETLNAAAAAHDALATARATAAFKFHLDIHLAKEDAHLYRLVRERVPDLDKMVGRMSSTVPPNRFPEAIAWLFAMLDPDDRENVTRVWQTLMPPPVFAQVKPLIRKAVGNDWAELTRKIPTLE